ncbi:MAG: UDP-N-acetylmuramoyl-L-alanyl-D-glutamate--2,6-diaminopimelate ligase [Candidatus Omnitrophica bacterium]|nr:UDP-N-acetylmuramoyl-L-alanyl-D-glutamate--2,6-diaminopimelate ligase [Candidatus Omnitrophota bacterium]
MKDLTEFLNDIRISEKNGENPIVEFRRIVADSRQVEKGDLFVALSGPKENGHRFIVEAVQRGAVAVICEENCFSQVASRVPMIYVSNTRKAFVELLAKYDQNLYEKVRLIGVTGTNGKTTTAYLVQYLLNQFTTCGLIGTIEYRWKDKTRHAVNTTPGPAVLIPLLSEMARDGVSYCISEVSSHALDQERTLGLRFVAALFTNLTQDHLDYHHNFENYYAAKRKLFVNETPPDIQVINVDNSYGRWLVEEVGKLAVTFGMTNQAMYQAQNVSVSLSGSEFDLFVRGGGRWRIKTNLGLPHNVYNVLGALSIISEMGFPLAHAAECLQDFPGVPGRMQRVEEGQPFFVLIDYAHTPDAFQNIFSAVRPLVTGKIISVFGCGGDRDSGKRPQMGRIAAQFSDAVILTNDNPRSEDPAAILSDIEKGIPLSARPKLQQIEDRREAIHQAMTTASEGDLVLILGKGHETEQKIGSQILSFDDAQVTSECLRESVKVRG